MTTQGVEERTKGTMPEVEGQKSPETKGKTPEDASKVSPEVTPKYTEEQLKALLHAAKSEAGREKKQLETEVASLKQQIQTKEDELADNKSEIERLQAKVDDLASDDPDKFNAVKELKAAQEERRQLKTDRRALEGEKAELTESKNELAIWKRDQLVYTIADEFLTADGKDVDLDSFKSVADKFNLSEREGLVALAETMGLKPKVELPEITPPITPYSGMTEGGQGEKTEEAKLKERYPTMYKK